MHMLALCAYRVIVLCSVWKSGGFFGAAHALRLTLTPYEKKASWLVLRYSG